MRAILDTAYTEASQGPSPVLFVLLSPWVSRCRGRGLDSDMALLGNTWVV